jgi:glycine cleavage system transcriptional repressor
MGPLPCPPLPLRVRGIAAPGGGRDLVKLPGLPMPKFAVITIGSDRPGIVAHVSTTLAGAGCNLEDVTTSILRGYFAMVFVLAAPEGTTEEHLLRRLQPATGSDLRFSVWPVGADAGHPDPTHVLTVYGEDQMGIVSAVSTCLARHQVNISDMSCRLHDAGVPVYVLRMELAPPEELSIEQLERELQATLSPLRLHASLRPLETEVL